MEWPDDPRDLDYHGLADALLSPQVSTCEDLLDSLYFVDTLSDEDYYDRLLEEADAAEIDLGPEDPSPEDLTLRIWLADRGVLERVHAEQYRTRPKTFRSYFCKTNNDFNWSSPDTVTHKKLEDDLNTWFDFKRKGRGARVFTFPSEDSVWDTGAPRPEDPTRRHGRVGR